jgi:hypothetical protein
MKEKEKRGPRPNQRRSLSHVQEVVMKLDKNKINIKGSKVGIVNGE